MLTDLEIIAMYNSNILPKDIAKTDGRSMATIYRILHKNDINVEDKRMISKNIVEQIKHLYAKGFSSREVALLVGVSSGNIRKILKKENLNRNGIESFGIKEEDIKKAIDEYKEGVGAKTVVSKYNFSDRFLYDELRRRGEHIRTYSEASCLNITNKRKRGLQGSIVIKGICIKFDSFYELLFIINSAKNDKVMNITRSNDIIPYFDEHKKRHYNPDFVVTYEDGSECVIEVKPIERARDREVLLKQQVAFEKYNCYKIVTEDDLFLYSEDILNSYIINTKEDLSKYVKRYKKRIRNEL